MLTSGPERAAKSLGWGQKGLPAAPFSTSGLDHLKWARHADSLAGGVGADPPGKPGYCGFVDSREALGSWLDGPKAAAERMGADFGYRGERLGRPRSGPGSMAGPLRRIGALCVDGWIASLIAYGTLAHGDPAKANLLSLPLFFAMSALLLSTTGTSIGKRLFGLRVVRLDGGRASIPQALLRTVLLCLVVPAAVWDRDQRGLHDKAVGTVEVRI